ncbi:hypothetical protein GOP47_0029752 [Adiantum capillus-veneris]|nr:hypothetical protein GOP47_0029752 [Adiantum capillus-veneris]
MGNKKLSLEKNSSIVWNQFSMENGSNADFGSTAMAFSCDDDEGEPPTRSQAEITLKHLLDKQLSTTARLEQVEFQQATESMYSSVHASSGISTLQDFVKTESAQKQLLEKTRLLQNVLDGMGYSRKEIQERCQRITCINNPAGTSSEKVTKRRRYGADPVFLLHSEAEDHQISSLECEHKLKEAITSSLNQTKSLQSVELEASLLGERERLRAISHLSPEAVSSRKPLFGVGERISEQLTLTPQDRARCSAEVDSSRLTNEVFSRPAPQVLDLHAYLKQRSESEPGYADAVLPKDNPGESEQLSIPRAQDHTSATEVSESDILRNRLSQEEIQKLPCGKFANYSPGNLSRVLYIKNLSKDVTEADLVALFIRYQDRDQPLLFRLMTRGRMKGQAFVTFSDEETSSKALHLLNGYKLRGKPMVIEFGHGKHGSSHTATKEFNEPSL